MGTWGGDEEAWDCGEGDMGRMGRVAGAQAGDNGRGH
jgi:hypothetical protein